MTVEILLLTEDGGKSGAEVMRIVTKKLCVRVDPRCQTQNLKLVPGTDHVSGVSGSSWRSTRKHTIDMLKDVATRLALGQFVLLHFDGDVRWARREESASVKFFKGKFTDKVRKLLQMNQKDPGALDQLIPLVPFFEMEAWLYQATDVAKTRCVCDGEKAKAHTLLFGEWRGDRTLLDEVENTKHVCCLKDDHNVALAQALPAAEVEAAGKSFAAVVRALKSNQKFLSALASTYP